MKPGDIIVYRERGQTLDADRTLRATFRGGRGYEGQHPFYEASRGGERLLIRGGDVVRIEPAQHGWAGAPATSGAW